jgi:hypothetical protein
MSRSVSLSDIPGENPNRSGFPDAKAPVETSIATDSEMKRLMDDLGTAVGAE